MPPMKRKRMSFVSGLAAYKKQKTAGQAALTAVASLKRRIAAATEVKSEDVTTTFAAPNTMLDTVVVTNLCQVGQGNGVSQRVGQQITAKRLSVRYHIEAQSSQAAIARVLIVQWKKQQPDTNPGLANVFENTGAGQAGISCYAFTAEFKENFRVLHDATYAIDAATRKSIFKEIDMPLNFKIAFNGSATSDIEKNGIYMFQQSDLSTSAPKIWFSSRLQYTDD